MSRRVLVTGATGCIGRAVVDAAVERGWTVIGCARRRPSGWSSGATFETADIRDEQRLAELAANADAVVHLAGRAHDERATLQELLASFAEGARNAAVAAQTAGARLILVSSTAVYGSTAQVDDSTIPDPDTPYGTAKLESERVVQGIVPDAIILRPTLVYGPYDRGNMSRLISLLAKIGPVVVGDGRNRKSILFAPNLAERISALIESSGSAGVWCASDREAPTQAELVRKLADSMRLSARSRHVPRSVAYAVARAMDIVARSSTWTRRIDRLTSSSVVDGGHLDEALGFREPTTLERALERTVAWTLGARDRAI